MLRNMQSVQDHMGTCHYASKTIKAYISWIKQYIIFHKMAHSSTLNEIHGSLTSR
ncbi:TPA: phage integrase N-terminal SAM-like domain-containing protein [Vibrio vulnificus]